jgi:hypothetical protein
MATISVAEFAIAIDTDPRTARKFLRAVTPKDAQPGKGSRWGIEKRDIRSLTSKFKKFEEAAAQKASDAAAAAEIDAPEDAADEVEMTELD